MKLVIDIPEEHYNSIVSGHDIEIYYGEHFVTKDSWASELIRKGTPLEQEPTTKNDLGVDCISRKAILDELEKWDWQELYLPIHFKQMLDELPTVTPQEPILDKIYADIQRLRGCSCSCSDGIIDDVEDILDKYKAESEDKE